MIAKQILGQSKYISGAIDIDKYAQSNKSYQDA
jgi:hypothetical protein